jgi:hypothetical protein
LAKARHASNFGILFFGTLGWDIHNAAGNADAYKDVVHTRDMQVGSTTKLPDYTFRVGGTRKFFLEAKKPAVRTKETTRKHVNLGANSQKGRGKALIEDRFPVLP